MNAPDTGDRPPRAGLRARAHALLAAPRTAPVLLGAWIVSRLLAVVSLSGTPLADDALDYHRMAVALLSGQRFEPDWPPGLPLYLALWYRLFGAHVWVGRLAVALLSALSAGLLLVWVRRAAGVVAGNLAVLLLLCAPSQIVLAATPLTQVPAALLLLALAVATTGALARPTIGRALSVGALLGGAVLVRPSNLLLVLVVPIAIAYRTRRLWMALVPAVVLVLLVGAWTAEARHLTGRFVFINNANAQNLFYGNNPDTPLYRTWWFGSHKRGEPGVPETYLRRYEQVIALPPGERDHAFTQAAIDHIAARPDLFVVRSLSRVRTFFAFDTFAGAQVIKEADTRTVTVLGLVALAEDGLCYLLVAALALLWLVSGTAAEAQPERRAGLVAVGLAVLYALPYFASFSHPTYHFPIIPLLAAPAAFAGARGLRGASFWPATRGRRRLLWAAWAVLLAIQLEWIAHMYSRV
ncbi:MAG TPA: glycosyltransferase family 39 protein [Polyangia bacterium]|nr:glycosyltransferase family 39 protein [Polyangia bacterium]